MAALWDWEKQKMHINDLVKYSDILTGKATSADGSKVAGELTGKYETNKATLRICRGILGQYQADNGDAVADNGIKSVARVILNVGSAINNDLGGTLGKPQRNAVAGLCNAATAVIGAGGEGKPASKKS